MVDRSPKHVEELNRFRILHGNDRPFSRATDAGHHHRTRSRSESAAAGDRLERGTPLVLMLRQRRSDRSVKIVHLEGLAQHGSILETLGYIVLPVTARENERNGSPRENF